MTDFKDMVDRMIFRLKDETGLIDISFDGYGFIFYFKERRVFSSTIFKSIDEAIVYIEEQFGEIVGQVERLSGLFFDDVQFSIFRYAKKYLYAEKGAPDGYFDSFDEAYEHALKRYEKHKNDHIKLFTDKTP